MVGACRRDCSATVLLYTASLISKKRPSVLHLALDHRLSVPAMAVLSLPLSFTNSFWSQGYRKGLEVLYEKLEQVRAISSLTLCLSMF